MKIRNITTKTSNKRIDKLLADKLSFSRNQIQDWIADELVKINGDVVHSKSFRPSTNTRITLRIPDSATTNEHIEPEDKPLDILYQDESLLAVDKPSGLLIHPAGNQVTNTLVNRLIYHFPDLTDVGESERPGLVHRLDRGTSGIVLVARSTEALEAMKGQFKKRTVQKKYRAVLSGCLEDSVITVKVPIARDPDTPILRCPDPSGKYAETRIERVTTKSNLTAVKCYPKTGRTHQIRIHCEYLDCPVAGDTKYGGKPADRLMLHAEELVFTHPTVGETITIQSNPPQEVMQKWNALQ